MPGTELAVGYVSLVPSGRGFGRSIIREARSAGSTAGDSASSAFGSRFVSGMGHIARRAGLAFTAGLATAGFFGIRTAADFEQTRIAFEGILGDVEKAKNLLGDLRDFAAVTPFEFTDLTTSAKQLLAVGVAADDIIPSMTILGNVAATLGAGPDAIESVVRALGQIKGKGKAASQELIQVSEALPGFSAIKAIAEGLGVSVGDAFKLVEEGAVPADEALRLILEGMERFPGASGAMERQSKTLNGVISTFKDTLATTAIDFITPYLPALSDGVRRFGGFIGEMAQGLQNFIDGAAFQSFKTALEGVVSDGLDAIRRWWDRNGDDINQFFISFANVAGLVLGAVGDWIWETVLPALSELGGWLIDNEAVLVGVLAALAAGMAAYAAASIAAAIANVIALLPFYLVLVALGLLAAALYYAWTNSDEFRHAVSKIAAALIVLGPQIVGFFQGLWHWAGMAYNVMRDVLDTIKDIIDLVPDLPGGFSGRDLIPVPPGLPLPWADDGGIWPGPKGVHSLGWVAGGETVLPTHKTDLPSGAPGSAPLIGTQNIYTTSSEDPGQATLRGLRKVKLMVAA